MEEKCQKAWMSGTMQGNNARRVTSWRNYTLDSLSHLTAEAKSENPQVTLWDRLQRTET